MMNFITHHSCLYLGSELTQHQTATHQYTERAHDEHQTVYHITSVRYLIIGSEIYRKDRVTCRPYNLTSSQSGTGTPRTLTEDFSIKRAHWPESPNRQTHQVPVPQFFYILFLSKNTARNNRRHAKLHPDQSRI